MEVHECVSFILVKDDEVLLETRSKDKDSDPGMIAIPGGHMEQGESQSMTLLERIRRGAKHQTAKVRVFVFFISPNHRTSIASLLCSH